MKEKLTLEMKMDDYLDPKFWFFPDEENANALKLIQENYEEIKKLTGCNDAMIHGLHYFSDIMHETFVAIKADMTDLYEEIKALKSRN